MKIGVNLTEEEAKAFKARKEQELGVGWCQDAPASNRWAARPPAPAVPPTGVSMRKGAF
jgi:hypothetical protein